MVTENSRDLAEGVGLGNVRQPVRRVVTGHDASGASRVVSDSVVESSITPQSSTTVFHLLWGGDETPKFPDAGEEPTMVGSDFPPVGGYRFWLVTFPAGLKAGPTHSTASIDFAILLSGELMMSVDDGTRVYLKPGDTLVQNGTPHSWANPGEVPATLAVIVCGATHSNPHDVPGD